MPRHPARRAVLANWTGQAHEQALNKPCVIFKVLHSFLSVLTLKSEKMLEQCQCFFPSFRLCNLFLLTDILTILLKVIVIVNSSQICSISHFFNECPLFSVCLAVNFYPQPFHCMVLKKEQKKGLQMMTVGIWSLMNTQTATQKQAQKWCTALIFIVYEYRLFQLLVGLLISNFLDILN